MARELTPAEIREIVIRETRKVDEKYRLQSEEKERKRWRRIAQRRRTKALARKKVQ